VFSGWTPAKASVTFGPQRFLRCPLPAVANPSYSSKFTE
jgi:hypothetical protein